MISEYGYISKKCSNDQNRKHVYKSFIDGTHI